LKKFKIMKKLNYWRGDVRAGHICPRLLAFVAF
jgi:hypothetical protein